jgi:hypothetical protein
MPAPLKTMSEGALRGRSALPVRGGSVASRTSADLTRDGLSGALLACLVVVVQLAWGGVLVYLGFRFL